VPGGGDALLVPTIRLCLSGLQREASRCFVKTCARCQCAAGRRQTSFTLGNIKNTVTAPYRTIRGKQVPRYRAEYEYLFTNTNVNSPK
jgi:hypothetical protein